MNFLPLLAFDADIIGIIILVLSVLGMFVRAVKGNNDNVNAPAKGNRPEKLRTEIEEFLEEISGNKPRKPDRPAAPQRPPARARPPVKQQQPRKPAPKPKPAPQQSQAAKPVKLSEQHLQTSDLGGTLRSHLASYMQPDRVAQEVQRDLQNRIAAGVEADLGRPIDQGSATTQPQPHPFAKMLRDPQGVRTAIAIQEILQRPRSLR